MRDGEIIFRHVRLRVGAISMAAECLRHVVNVAFACCSPKDQFSKRKGRLIARGRLDLCRVGGLRKPQVVAIHEGPYLFRRALKSAYDGGLLPGWAEDQFGPWKKEGEEVSK
jgi:hypothetical protein